MNEAKHFPEAESRAMEQVIRLVGEGADQYEVQIVGGIELRRFTGRGDVEWRQRDIDLGTQLGYGRPRDIRALINSLKAAEKLNDLIVRGAAPRTSGGRPTDEFWLTEAQALKVAAKSETDVADQILDRIIAVYQAVKRDARAAIAAEVELLRRQMASQHEQVQQLLLDNDRTRTALREQADGNARGWSRVGELERQIQALSAGPMSPQQHDWLKEAMREVAALRCRVTTHLTFDKVYARVQRDVRERLQFTLEWEQLPYARFDVAYLYLRRLHKIAIKEAREVGYSGADTWTQPPLPLCGVDDDEEDET